MKADISIVSMLFFSGDKKEKEKKTDLIISVFQITSQIVIFKMNLYFVDLLGKGLYSLL